MQRITPFLWFDDQAEEAANFYVSVFKNSKIVQIARYSEAVAAAAGRKKGSVMVVSFILDGQEFTALNGGPYNKISPAISFVVNCTTQAEVDYYWDKLTNGGAEEQCGWLKDKFGVSWQVVPTSVIEMIADKDAAKSERVMQAVFQMKKIDIQTCRQAYDQR